MVESCGDHVTSHPLNFLKPSTQLDVRIFCVRICNCEVRESTPKHLTVNHLSIGVSAVNGKKSSFLRRDRADTRFEETTIFISTDPVRIARSEKFEVFNGDVMLIAGVLVPGKIIGRWGMKCWSVVPVASKGFMRGRKPCVSFGAVAPMIEVCVAGCCCGGVVFMNKAIPVGSTRKEKKKKKSLDSIPENEVVKFEKEELENGFQLPYYQNYGGRNAENFDYRRIYSPEKFREKEQRELSWFNAGVKAGVGISVGMCLAVGILMWTRKATAGNSIRQLV